MVSATRQPKRNVGYDLSSLGAAELEAMERLIEAVGSHQEGASDLPFIEGLRCALTRAHAFSAELDTGDELLGTALLGGEVSCDEAPDIFGGDDGVRRYCVVVVSPYAARAPGGLAAKLAMHLKEIFPGRVVPVDDVVAMVCINLGEEAFEVLRGRIRATCELLGVEYALGLSDVTTHFDLISVLFDHARFASCAAAKRNEELLRYKDCMFEYMISKTNFIENFAYLRDLRVLTLYDSDKNHGSDLLNTVITYIESGFSLSRTATEMGLHRNSVVYRLNRIAERCHIDLLGPTGNYDVLNLLLTCKVYRSHLGEDAVPSEWIPTC